MAAQKSLKHVNMSLRKEGQYRDEETVQNQEERCMYLTWANLAHTILAAHNFQEHLRKKMCQFSQSKDSRALISKWGLGCNTC